MKKRLKTILQHFFEDYAIEFKKNGKKFPSYISLTFDYSFEEDWEFEGEPESVVHTVYFFDENKKEIKFYFYVNIDVFEEIRELRIDEALGERIDYEYACCMKQVEDDMEGEKYLSVKFFA